MASVYDYTFNLPSRIGFDQTDLSQRTLQNSSYSSHILDKLNVSGPLTSYVDFATSQPNINFTGSQHLSIGGTNVDESSKMIMTDMSRDRCRISLVERPFLTVPYLGRGKCDVTLEGRIQQGDFANNKKSTNPSSEVCYSQYSETPMLPALKASIANPNNICENSASEGWIRGGLPSREMARETNNK